MDFADFLPSPSDLLRTSASLFNSTIQYYTRARTINTRHTPREFDVDHDTGFLPPAPIPRLPPNFSLWEEALEEAADVLGLGDDTSEDAIEKRPGGVLWRSKIASWPILDVNINDLRVLQRAHCVLAFLVHYYVHSTPSTYQPDGPVHIPAALAVPFVAVSNKLEMAPVLTYADTVLWNWDLINPTKPISIENITFRNCFSGTDDEQSFYMTSLHVELRSVELLQIIDELSHMPDSTDSTTIARVMRYLTRLRGIIEDLTAITKSVRQICDPHTFYWDIRPWFEGADAGGPSGPGWEYDGVAARQLDLSGPSGGQSSSMHALDIFLDIDHKLHQRRYPAPSEGDKRVSGFMERMRHYMPGPHRRYLEYLEMNPRPVRSLALSIPTLRETYNATVKTMQTFRDQHMRIASLYIVTMSKSVPGTKSMCPASAMLDRIQAAKAAAGKEPVRGTGGNELAVLLKACRDATKRASLT